MEENNTFEHPAKALVMILYIASVMIVFIGIYYLSQEATALGLSVFGAAIVAWFMAEVLNYLCRIAEASESRIRSRTTAAAPQSKNAVNDGSYSLD